LLYVDLPEKRLDIFEYCGGFFFEPVSDSDEIYFFLIDSLNILNVHLNYLLVVVVDGESVISKWIASMTMA
jgi:hypothetical protein